MKAETLCRKCGLELNRVNANRRPELFLHNDCLPIHLQPERETGDIVAKIQQGNWTDADVSEAVAEIVRLRREVDRMNDLPLCRRQLPDGCVPENTEQALLLWIAVADGTYGKGAKGA